MSFRGNLVCLLDILKYINLNANFKLEKNKKDYSMYLDIKLEKLRDTIQVVLNGV